MRAFQGNRWIILGLLATSAALVWVNPPAHLRPPPGPDRTRPDRIRPAPRPVPRPVPAQVPAWGPGYTLDLMGTTPTLDEAIGGDEWARQFAEDLADALNGWDGTPPERLAYFADAPNQGLELKGWSGAIDAFSGDGAGCWVEVFVSPQASLAGESVAIGTSYMEWYWVDPSGIYYAGGGTAPGGIDHWEVRFR
jgi:hypothetical protein